MAFLSHPGRPEYVRVLYMYIDRPILMFSGT